MISEKKRNGNDNSILGESRFALFMIVFVVLEILLLVILLCNSPTSQAKDPTPPPSGGDLPSPPDQTTVTLPKDTSNTQTLSSIDSKYALLFNTETGEVMASRNADTKFSPASLTKVMTLIVACEELDEVDLDRRLAHTQEIINYVSTGNYAGTSFALNRSENYIGDTFTIRDLLYGIGVASAADCTYMVVKDVAGSEEAFVELMNEKAAAMGLKDTHFDNAVGFDSPNNVTTAREMAAIMAYAMENELIADILKVRDTQDGKYKITGYYVKDGKEESYALGLTISLDSRFEKYPEFSMTTADLEATKTGYTDESFMVASAIGKTSGDRYVLVLGTTGSPAGTSTTQKFKNTMTDMEAIFNKYAK